MSDQSHSERRAFRAGRVRLAFLTSAGSKAIGLLVQFLAFPLAVRSLGTERFGIYTMLVSALVWIDLGRLGIGPGLTRELAIAWNRGERDRERVLFANATFILIGIATAIGVILTSAFWLGSAHIEGLFGEAAGRYRWEIQTSMIVIEVLLIGQVILSIGEAARSAYQEDFFNNLMNTVANLASLLLILWVAWFWPTVVGFALAIYGSIVMAKIVNVFLLLGKSRPYLVPRLSDFNLSEVRPLLGSSFAFWGVQIAVLMMQNLSLVQLGQVVGAAQLTPFAVVFRFIQILSTGVLMISTPLWPAITDAAVRGDVEWIRKSYRRLILSAMMFSILAGTALGALGPMFIPLWAGGEVRPDHALSAVIGCYFVIWMWSHCHAMVLFGLGKLWSVAGAMLLEGALVLILAALLIPRYGAVGTGIALCLAALVTTAWMLPLMVRRSLARLNRDDASGLSAAGLTGSTQSEGLAG